MPDEPAPYGSENRTFICTVVFVDLVGYSQQTVTQQLALKRHLNGIIGRALAAVAESDRLTLDTGDGAALCFFGDPEDALFAAAHLRDAMRTDPGPGAQVRIGINLGPARVVKDLNGNRNVIGDGINVAQRVMGFSQPNQILVSRSYYEVVSHISTEYAQLFQYAGLHRDKHVREHEVYEVHGGRGAAATGGDRATPGIGEGSTFAPDVLARVTRSLTGHLGPVAKLIVQRASMRARDARELIAAASDSLTGKSRDAFMAEVADLTAAPRPAAPPAAAVVAAPSSSAGDRTAPAAPDRRRFAPITPELLAAVEARLAQHVGPIARLLVTQAAKDVADAGELVDRLALRIDSEAARRSFLAAMRKG